MKILVVNFAASSGGALSILRDFYKYIKVNDKRNDWIFLLSDTYIEETDRIKVLVNKRLKESWIERLKFDFLTGKKIVNQIECDAIINFQNTIIRGIKKRQILYVHQPIPFQKEKNFSFLKRDERKLAIYQKLIGKLIFNSIKKADSIIVQTKWMKESIVEKKLCKKENIFISAPNVEIIKGEQAEIGYNKFFYPAANINYKNHKVIYEACEILNDKNIENYNIQLTIENNSNIKINQIEFLGNIKRQEVFEKYSNRILLFPSYIETYGLPLAECREMNGIIIAADTKFSREILDDYENAYFFNYKNAEDLAVLMEKFINGKLLKNKVKKSMKKKNSWEDIIKILTENGGGQYNDK